MFDYGEVLFKTTWVFGLHRYKNRPLFFRFRCGPVPGIRNWSGGSYFSSYYKTPKTQNERKAWYNSEGYGRAKRAPINLPNAYDDRQRSDRSLDRSWKKNKIRRQWMKHL